MQKIKMSRGVTLTFKEGCSNVFTKNLTFLKFWGIMILKRYYAFTKHKRRLYYGTQISRIMDELRNLLILDGHKTARHVRNVGHGRITQRKRQMLVSQRPLPQNGQKRKYVMQQIWQMGALEKVIPRWFAIEEASNWPFQGQLIKSTK